MTILLLTIASLVLSPAQATENDNRNPFIASKMDTGTSQAYAYFDSYYQITSDPEGRSEIDFYDIQGNRVRNWTSALPERQEWPLITLSMPLSGVNHQVLRPDLTLHAITGFATYDGGEVVMRDPNGKNWHPHQNQFNYPTASWFHQEIDPAKCKLIHITGEGEVELSLPSGFTFDPDETPKIEFLSSSTEIILANLRGTMEGETDGRWHSVYWKGGKPHVLKKPEGVYTNLDGRASRVVSWGAKYVNCEGLIFGMAGFDGADEDPIISMLPTVWNGDKVEILKIPHEYAKFIHSLPGIRPHSIGFQIESVNDRGDIALISHCYKPEFSRAFLLSDGKWHNIQNELDIPGYATGFDLFATLDNAILRTADRREATWMITRRGATSSK